MNRADQLKDYIYDPDLTWPLFGKHYNGTVHAIFASVDAAHAWTRGLGRDAQYFHLEDRDGKRLTTGSRSAGHAYAILDALDRRDRGE